MNRIAGGVIKSSVYARRMNFRTQPSMYEPLLKPDRFQCASRYFTEERCYVWSAESSETILSGITCIRVTTVEGCTGAGENEERLKVSLEQYINVYPLSDVSTITHVTRDRVKRISWLIEPTLHCEPCVEVSHIV